MTKPVIFHAENAKALFIFAHGAGAGFNSDFMQQMTKLLQGKGISVACFNFDYMQRRVDENRKFPPDRMPKLVDCYLRVMQSINTDVPIFIGGKSMGSRVAATLLAEMYEDAQEVSTITGYIALGYPFHPQGKPENLRLEPLSNPKVPMLIVQGDRDKLGNKEEIASYALSTEIACAYLPDGDHDLKPRVKSGFTHHQHMQSAAEQIDKFISRYV